MVPLSQENLLFSSTTSCDLDRGSTGVVPALLLLLLLDLSATLDTIDGGILINSLDK